MAGICVSLLNFLAYGYTIEKLLGKSKRQWVIVITYFIRMGFIVITILPFVKNIEHMAYYMSGFVSHYILLVVFGIKNRKGSV